MLESLQRQAADHSGFAPRKPAPSTQRRPGGEVVSATRRPQPQSAQLFTDERRSSAPDRLEQEPEEGVEEEAALEMAPSVRVSQPVESSASSAATSGSAKASGASCSVDSFGLTIGKWQSWSLPVDFDVTLGSGCDRKDVRIGQLMKGRLEFGSHTHDFPSWRFDNVDFDKNGEKSTKSWDHWWDGAKWNAANGFPYGWRTLSWNESASFKDQPGWHFFMPTPAYMGGVGHKGHFEFRTYVRDAAGTTLRQLEWGILIDYPGGPTKKGRKYYYL